jgi:alanine-synthesizing transaminase
MFSKRTNWSLEHNAYTRALGRHRQSGRRILDLTASNPTECGFEYDQAAILAALRDPDALRYEPVPKGLSTARAAVAAYYTQMRADVRVDPERLILTTGTSEAYSFLFRLLCEPGDEVLIAHPSYPLFEFLATIHDVNLRPFSLLYDHGWQIDFHALQNAIGPRCRAILLVHPNNPTGHFIAEDEAAELNALCRQHDLAQVVDEVFFDYPWRDVSPAKARHDSFASNVEALTFVLSGLSKISALPQMKIGWIATNGPDTAVRDAIARLEIIADTYLSLSTPMQHALSILLDQRRTMQPQIIARVEENLRQLDEQLSRQKLASRLAAEGGWYAVLRIPAVATDEELAIRLLDHHSVSVHPGHFYDFSSEGHLVVSLLTPADDFKAGIAALLECLAAS